MTTSSATANSSEVLLVRLGESAPGFPAAAEAIRILLEQATNSPHKLALLPTRMKPAARAEGGTVMLESDGKILAEASIVRSDARPDFAPEMRAQWATAGLTESKGWLIVKGLRVIDAPLEKVLQTTDGKGLDRTVGNRQFRWMSRIA